MPPSKKQIEKKLKEGADVRLPARMGRADGTLASSGKAYTIWVTLEGSGAAVEVLNMRIPAAWGRCVWVGFDPYNYPTRRQVLGIRDVYPDAEWAGAPDHAPTHQWPAPDTVYSRAEQILPALVTPVAGSLSVTVWPATFRTATGWKKYTTIQAVSVSASVPATGARYSLLVADATGALVLRDGTPVASRADLTDADIPEPEDGDTPIAVLILEAGITELVKLDTRSDILDLRFTAGWPALWLPLTGGNVTGQTRFGNATDYVQIDNAGKLLLAGAATVWDDLTTPLIGSKLESPSSHIVTNNAECTIEFKTSCDLTDYLIAVPQMTHKWKMGSSVGPHLHWEQASATMPNWLIQFRWQRQGQAKNATWTSQKYTANAFTYSAGTLNQITAFGTITPPSGYSLSDLVDIRILRDVANTSGLFAGADGLAASAFAKSFDTHVEFDTLGSNDEYVK
jgi:hypothetical protein